MEDNKICVLIPVYNCENKIKGVIASVLMYTSDVLVVNDGSTDNTLSVIQEFKNITIVSYPKNKGKGYALWKGFKKAAELGFTAVITMDGDGQHLAKDLKRFFDFSRNAPHVISVGARYFDVPNMPSGSVFANKFSNFWFTWLTTKKLPDTQSGFRYYPIYRMKKMRPFTNRFETEFELLVRAAWRGIYICAFPVSVHYDPKEERISHFRPKMDFLRISLLNFCLCIIAIIYGYPSTLYYNLKEKIEYLLEKDD